MKKPNISDKSKAVKEAERPIMLSLSFAFNELVSHFRLLLLWAFTASPLFFSNLPGSGKLNGNQPVMNPLSQESYIAIN
jgi:hypothetical protein